MGLLDDAIREHLELKRLRGADPGEVARAEEQDALGPVSREADATVPAGEHDDEPVRQILRGTQTSRPACRRAMLRHTSIQPF